MLSNINHLLHMLSISHLCSCSYALLPTTVNYITPKDNNNIEGKWILENNNKISKEDEREEIIEKFYVFVIFFGKVPSKVKLHNKNAKPASQNKNKKKDKKLEQNRKIG